MKKIFTLISMALMAIGVNAQTTIYSWESPEGTAVETGGTAVGNGADEASVNYASSSYYTIRLSSKKANIASDNVTITLTQALAAGDEISFTAFIKKDESREASAYILFADGVDAESEVFGDNENIGLTGAIATKTVTVPEAAAGVTTIKLARGKSGTNLFITKLTITRAGGGAVGTAETYNTVTDGAYSAEFAAIVDANGVATNVANGNSIVKFSTASVEVEGVSTGTPADLADGGQDLTIGASVGDNEYEYTVNSTKEIKWQLKNQGDINYYYIQGTGVPSVKAVAEEVLTDGKKTGKYRLKYTAFDPAVGGLPVTGLYYKITTKADGAIKFGIWANKGNHSTYLVDAETKQVSDFLVEGYINGQNDESGAKKWLTNDEIKAIHDAAKVVDGVDTAPYVIGAGNQPFWGDVIVDAKANKTYYLFQGTTQIGFQGFTFVPGAKKEELTKIEAVQNITKTWNANAPMYNLSGQKVDKSYKGIVIQNGKKFMNK